MSLLKTWLPITGFKILEQTDGRSGQDWAKIKSPNVRVMTSETSAETILKTNSAKAPGEKSVSDLCSDPL